MSDMYSGLLFAGRLADIYGRKLLFITGLVIALIFSILSALIRVWLSATKLYQLTADRSGAGPALCHPCARGSWTGNS